MRGLLAAAYFLSLSYVGRNATGFVVQNGVLLDRHHRIPPRFSTPRKIALSMRSEGWKPTARREAIAAGVTGLLVALVGASSAGAEIAPPESLPSCPTQGNCVSSTSFKLVMQGKYLAPWYYLEDGSDAGVAFSKLEEAVKQDPNLKLLDSNPEGLFLRATARSAVPPDGVDIVEFLIKPADGLVTFRSRSMKNVYAGPVLVGDGGSNRNRLESLRKKLGWPERGIDDYMKEQGIDTGSSRAKGYLSEFGWRKTESQSYGEEEDE